MDLLAVPKVIYFQFYHYRHHLYYNNLKWERNGNLVDKWSVDWWPFQSGKTNSPGNKSIIVDAFPFSSFILEHTETTSSFAKSVEIFRVVWVIQQQKIFLIKVKYSFEKSNFLIIFPTKSVYEL